MRRHQKAAVRVLPCVPGQHVEQVREVRADRGIGCEQADVLVEPRGLRVVVARPDVAVPADRRSLLAHHERGLAVRLEPDQAVHHVHARLLQCPRPLDVRLLVEPRLDLDQRDDLLARFGRVDQRVHNGRITRCSVERLLDREHVRVAGRLLDETLHTRRERVVRVMHQHVALPQRGEHALGRLVLGERRVRRGHERGVLEVLAVHGMQLPQARQVQQPVDDHDVVRVHFQLTQQQLLHVLAHVAGDLQPDRRTEAALRQLALQREQQVLVAVLLDFQVRVSGHPELVHLGDVHSGEQLTEVGPDQVLQRQERGAPFVSIGLHLEQPRHVVGHLHPGEALGARLGVPHGDREVERQPRDVGERVRRIDRERCQHREDLVGEVDAQPLLVVLLQLRPAHDPDPALRQLRSHTLLERRRLLFDELLVALGDVRQLLARGQPVGAAHRKPGLPAALEPGDPDHVELVEVGCEDREELRPFEQRLRLVLGQGEHPGIEVQPGQFPVEIPVVRQSVDGRGGCCRRGRG
nr:hypothetical protein [Kibdelosporangium sp. MJ126-NF4]